MAQKNGGNSASKHRKSSCRVSNKTYRVWDLYEIMHSGVKAHGFSELSNKIGYTLSEHNE